MFAGASLQLKAAHRLPGTQQLPLNRPGRVAGALRHFRVAEAEPLQPHQSLLARRQPLKLPELVVGGRELVWVRRG